MRYTETTGHALANARERSVTPPRNDVTPRKLRIVTGAYVPVSRAPYMPLTAVKPFWPASHGCSGFAVVIVPQAQACATAGNDAEHV